MFIAANINKFFSELVIHKIPRSKMAGSRFHKCNQIRYYQYIDQSNSHTHVHNIVVLIKPIQSVHTSNMRGMNIVTILKLYILNNKNWMKRLIAMTKYQSVESDLQFCTTVYSTIIVTCKVLFSKEKKISNWQRWKFLLLNWIKFMSSTV